MHGVWTGCAQGVHRLYTSCAEGVHNLCTGCAQAVHRLCTGCAQAVHGLCTRCAQGVHGGRTGGVHRACTGRAQGVHKVCTGCARGVHRVCTRCAWGVHGCYPRELVLHRLRFDLWPLLCSNPPSDRAERLLSTATSGNLFGTAAVRAMAAFVFDPFIGYSGTFAIGCYRPLTVFSTRCGSSNGRFAFDREWQRCSRHQRNHFTIMPHVGSVDTSDLRVPASGPGSIALAPNA